MRQNRCVLSGSSPCQTLSQVVANLKKVSTCIELKVSQAPSNIISLSSGIFHHLVFGAETMKGGGDLWQKSLKITFDNDNPFFYLHVGLLQLDWCRIFDAASVQEDFIVSSHNNRTFTFDQPYSKIKTPKFSLQEISQNFGWSHHTSQDKRWQHICPFLLSFLLFSVHLVKSGHFNWSTCRDPKNVKLCNRVSWKTKNIFLSPADLTPSAFMYDPKCPKHPLLDFRLLIWAMAP